MLLRYEAESSFTSLITGFPIKRSARNVSIRGTQRLLAFRTDHVYWNIKKGLLDVLQIMSFESFFFFAKFLIRYR